MVNKMETKCSSRTQSQTWPQSQPRPQSQAGPQHQQIGGSQCQPISAYVQAHAVLHIQPAALYKEFHLCCFNLLTVVAHLHTSFPACFMQYLPATLCER